MRIAIVTDNDFAKLNGVTTTLRAVLAHGPQDIRPHVYTISRDDAQQPGYTAFAGRGMPIPFYAEMRMYVPRVGAIRRRLAQDGVDAIHLTTPGPAGLAARHLAAGLGVPLVGSYHTELGAYAARLSGSPHLGRLMQQYLQWLYGACAQVLVPSVATRDHLAACGWRPGRLRVWARGVDPASFSPDRRSRAMRAGWRVSDARPAILYAGRLSKEKGLLLLPLVQQRLEASRVPHRFVICGDGPLHGELRRTLRDAVFTGAIGHEMMGEVMASSDLLLFPSDTDTAGNVVLEAQAAGLPVLVSDCGGPQENMVHRATGFVCRAGSQEDFARRAAELLVDAAKRAGMSAAARRYGLTRSWSEAMQPLFACYREVVNAAARHDRTAGRVQPYEAHG